MYDMNIIETDFVLVSGDVVSNMKLNSAIEKHKYVDIRTTNGLGNTQSNNKYLFSMWNFALIRKWREKDKSAIMTTILKKASPTHRSRAGEDSTIVAVDKDNGQLLYFDNSESPEVN